VPPRARGEAAQPVLGRDRGSRAARQLKDRGLPPWGASAAELVPPMVVIQLLA